MFRLVGWKATGWSALVGLLTAASLPVSAQIGLPSGSDKYAAKVVTLTGQVSLLKDNQPWALSTGDTVQVSQIIISGVDGHAMFQVSDGSTFEVFPNSRVVFRKNVWDWKDLIDVIVGRVKVHIEHWGNQPNPNRVFTPTAVISVRGTTFDVSVDEESEATLVEVEEGEVVVSHALIGGATRTLRTGESTTVYRTVPLTEARMFQKGTVIQYTVRAIKDALQTIATQQRVPGTSIPGGGSGGGVGGGTGGNTGDTGKPTPPPPPPPPPQ